MLQYHENHDMICRHYVTLHDKDTSAVAHPIADPSAKAPKNTPKKFPKALSTSMMSKEVDV